jgi:hypothetical protein
MVYMFSSGLMIFLKVTNQEIVLTYNFLCPHLQL